jgi:hypothetical protein
MSSMRSKVDASSKRQPISNSSVQSTAKEAQVSVHEVNEAGVVSDTRATKLGEIPVDAIEEVDEVISIRPEIPEEGNEDENIPDFISNSGRFDYIPTSFKGSQKVAVMQGHSTNVECDENSKSVEIVSTSTKIAFASFEQLPKNENSIADFK